MENVLILALLTVLLILIMILGLVLIMIWKVKRVLTRALTFVFTLSLKPRWTKL